MDTSLGHIRSLALSLGSWNSSGHTFDGRVRDAVNAALQRMANDVPNAIVPSEEHIVLLAPVDSSSDTVDVMFQATPDPWVLEITDAAGGSLGASALTAWRPAVDGSWDGLMHLEVELPGAENDEQGRRQSREWWTVASSARYYVSLDRRWRNVSDADMHGRIYMKNFFTRADVVKILDPIEVWDAGRYQSWSLSASTARRQGRGDFQRQATGPIQDWWRSGQFQMPAPTEPPIATAAPTVQGGGIDVPWVGPLPQGDFNFVYTYAWGRRDAEWQEGGNSGIRDPVWESAPSPEMTATFSHTLSPDRAIILQAPNIDAMQNFFTAGGTPGATRHGRSGFRIRFYARRAAIRTATGAVEFRFVETNERQYLLAEIDPTDTVVAGPVPTTFYTAYAWTGEQIPDLTRQLVRSQGYYAWQVSPHQDRRYELDLSVLRRPTDLIDDQDTPPIQPGAWTVFMELVGYYLCLMDGVDAVNAREHLDRYTAGLLDVRAMYGQTGTVVEPVPFGGGYDAMSLNIGHAVDVP